MVVFTGCNQFYSAFMGHSDCEAGCRKFTAKGAGEPEPPCITKKAGLYASPAGIDS